MKLPMAGDEVDLRALPGGEVRRRIVIGTTRWAAHLDSFDNDDEASAEAHRLMAKYGHDWKRSFYLVTVDEDNRALHVESSEILSIVGRTR